MYPDHIITEWLLDINENDLTFYIYKIDNITFKDIWVVSQSMQKEYGILSFYGLYVATWNQFNFKNVNIANKNIELNIADCKTIKNYMFVKKKLLQDLIIQSIKMSQTNNEIWRPVKDNTFITYKGKIVNIFYGKKVCDVVEVYKKLKLFCNIKSDGSIYISFYPSLFTVSLLNLSQITDIKKGDSLIDVINGGKIIYDKISDYSNIDVIPELSMSIKDFLQSKDINTIIEYNKDDINLVLNENKIDINIREKLKEIKDNKLVLGHYEDFFRKMDKYYKPKSYSFCAQSLRLDKNRYMLRSNFNEEFNVIDAVEYVKSMINNTNKFGNTLIKFGVDGINLLNQKFDYYNLTVPNYIIGDNISKDGKNIKSLLDINGVIKTNYRKYKIHVDIISLIKNNFVEILVKNIKDCSVNYKMNINFEDIKYTEKIDDLYIKNIYKNNVKNSRPVFVIFDGTNSEYQRIKRIFAKWGVSNQMINYNKLKNLEKDFNKDKILNILLGLYFKMGKYPWMLDYKFNANCFVGLDISHENNKHTIACVAYIVKGNDIQFREIGKQIAEVDYKDGKEKISDKSMRTVLNMLITECKKVNPKLNHIVIHRDGFCRNSEQIFFKDFFEKAQIKYTIISILKKINRKIIMKIDGQNKYGSFISSYLNYDEKFSYIISTNVMGKKLSNPYKIQFVDSNYEPSYTLSNAVDDIYNLTYMCFHTTLKTRLPATIFYSDKSSTSHNRDYIKCEKVYQKVFQP